MNNQGVILITTIIILIFVSVLGMSLLTFLFSSASYSQVQLDRLKAQYLAEAGISKALWELRYDIDLDGNGIGNIAKTKLGDGFFSAKHNFQNAVITASADVNRSRRILQIKYSAI